MDLELTGKVAVITGASRGVGKAIAREAAGFGTHVIWRLSGDRGSDDVRRAHLPAHPSRSAGADYRLHHLDHHAGAHANGPIDIRRLTASTDGVEPFRAARTFQSIVGRCGCRHRKR